MSFAKNAVTALVFSAMVPAVCAKSLIVGGDFSTSFSGEAEAEFDGASFSAKEDIDTSSLRVFAGYQTESNNRFKVSFESRSFDLSDSNEEEDATGLRLDADFVYGEDKIKPFWTIGLGFYNLSDPVVLEGSNLEGEDMSGVSFQIGGGIKAELSPQAEMSLSLDSQAISWEDVDLEGTSITMETTYSFISLNAGIQFLF